MKVNKDDLAKLAEKSDAELWQQIQAIAESHGYSLPAKMPSRENMQKIRSAMLGMEKLNISDAAKILNSYKKK